MADPIKPLTGPVFVDINNEPVKVVNEVVFHGPEGGLCDVTFCTVRTVSDGKGGLKRESIVASRLRFDIRMVQAIRDGLNQQLELAEAPPPRPN